MDNLVLYDKKKQQLLLLLEESIEEAYFYKKKCSGTSLIAKVRKLIRYRQKYLKHIIASRFRLPFNKSVKAEMFFGKSIYIPLADSISPYFYFIKILEGPEINLIKFLIKNLKYDDVFYDVGAHFGFYSLLTNEIIASGNIYAFEPSPCAFNYLNKNFQNNVNVTLNNIALSNKQSRSVFYDFSAAGSGELSTLVRETLPRCSKINSEEIEVETNTLDNYVRNRIKPTIIKIDVEGGEGLVIEGGKEIMQLLSPVVCMEVWKEYNKGQYKAAELLTNWGYKSYKINTDGDLEKVLCGDVMEKVTEGFDNVVFKK
ncbi:MAG: FkbM family methyltransferase [Patescibacteria group bacterium]